MVTRGDILREYYGHLVRKVSTWIGVMAIIGSVFVPMGAEATVSQLTPRKATLTTSAPVAGTQNVTFTFNPSVLNSGATIKAIGFQLCGTSPIDGASCTVLSSSTMAAASFSTGSAGNTAPFTANWAMDTTGANCGNRSTTYACIFWTTGSALASGTSYSIVIGGVQIPEVANTEFYTRITTYTAYAAGTPSGETDFGAEALSTGTTMSETAVVQESLVLAVGTSGASCAAISGSPAITLTNSPMSTTTTSSGTALICANTNAQGGYILTYTGTAFAGGGTTFPTVAAPTAGFTSTTGSQQFGFNLVDTAENEVSGASSTGKCDSSAGGLTPDSGSYCVSAKYNYDTTAGSHNIASSQGVPSADTIYTVTFKANIDTAVKPGSYTATQTYICTGTF